MGKIISISKLLGNYNQRHPGLVSESGTPYFIVYLSILRNLKNSDKLQTHGLSIHVAFPPSENGGGFYLCTATPYGKLSFSG